MKKRDLSFLVLVFFILAVPSRSQWISTNGPYWGMVYALAVSPNGAGGNNLFAGTSAGGVFLSTNNGTSWTRGDTVARFGIDNVSCGQVRTKSGIDAGQKISFEAQVFLNSAGSNGQWASIAFGDNWSYYQGQSFGLKFYNGSIFAYQSTPTESNIETIGAYTPGDIVTFGLARNTDGTITLSAKSFTKTYTNPVSISTFRAIIAVANATPDGFLLRSATVTQIPPKPPGDYFISSSLWEGHVWSDNVDIGSWFPTLGNGLTAPYVWSLAVSGRNLFAGTWGGVYLSTNNGITWTADTAGLRWTLETGGSTRREVWSLAVSGKNLFAGTNGGGVFLSTNNGTSWTAVNTGLTNPYVWSLAVSGTSLFAASDGGGVFLSTNNGTSWTTVNNGLTSPYFWDLAVSGMNLFAASNGGGVFLSTNNGTSWTAVNTGLKNTNVFALALSGTNLFAGTWSGGVFLSTNNGTSWKSFNTGLKNDSTVYALAVSSMNLFAGTHNGTVWRRPLSDTVTSVDMLSSDVPTHFSLDQNYPNPFNPSTTIRFDVPKAANVTLKIFNTLGQEVALLVNGGKDAGYYQATWNANVPSGVYFYRLQAGEFVDTKKMTLLR